MSDAVLAALSRALRLDEVEAAHLRDLAAPGRAPASRARRRRSAPIPADSATARMLPLLASWQAEVPTP